MLQDLIITEPWRECYQNGKNVWRGSTRVSCRREHPSSCRLAASAASWSEAHQWGLVWQTWSSPYSLYHRRRNENIVEPSAFDNNPRSTIHRYWPVGMYGLRTSGTRTPSSVWWFSRMAQMVRVVAVRVAFNMWTYSACGCDKSCDYQM